MNSGGVADFFRDSRGILSAFTVISLLAGITLVTAPMVCRLVGWPALSRDEVGSLTLLYCISALSDALLGVYLSKTIAVNLDAPPATPPAGDPATPGSQEA